MESNYYKEYYLFEKLHWWFKARAHILYSQIKKRVLIDNQKKYKILNVGVATGATSIMLEQFGEVISVEYDKDCCLFLQNELKMDIVNASLTDLPFENNSFDIVCAFDVIEHIENDNAAIQEIKRVLKSDGKYVITVPSYNFLWSKHDVINQHYRRYTVKGLKSTLERLGLKTSYYSYFNFYFFLPILMVRIVSNLLKRNKLSIENTGSDFEKFKKSSILNKALYWIFKSENFFLSLNIKFPFGVSMLFIGGKN